MVGFRNWLETQEHPLVSWHQEYQNAVAQERKRRSHIWTGIPTNKPSASMLTDSRTYVRVVLVISVKGDSSGLHGYGDQPDVPASNPLEDAKWEYHIGAGQEVVLRGLPAFIVDQSGGSFHERWGDVGVYVIVDGLPSRTRENLSYFTIGRKELGHIKKFFVFESIEQAADELINWEPSMSFPVQDNETREDYFKRIIASLPQPKINPDDTYEDDDNYYKNF